MRAPTYDIGSIVYLRESASVGFIEAYVVSEIKLITTGDYVYTLKVPSSLPLATQTMGDRIVGKRSKNIIILESDLITYCEALQLVAASLQSQLNTITTELANCDGTS